MRRRRPARGRAPLSAWLWLPLPDEEQRGASDSASAIDSKASITRSTLFSRSRRPT